MAKDQEGSQRTNSKEMPYKQKGLFAFGLKMVFYASLTLFTLGVLDYYNVPSHLLHGWKKQKERVASYFFTDTHYHSSPQSLETLFFQLPDSTRDSIVSHYFSSAPEKTKHFLLSYTKPSSLEKLMLTQEEKVGIITHVYKTLNNTGKWEVTKQLTKETFGF